MERLVHRASYFMSSKSSFQLNKRLQHNWLVSHNIIEDEPKRGRDYYVDAMKKYYYSTSDSVWSSWSDSQLKNWLVAHNIIKSDAEVPRNKMLNLVKYVLPLYLDERWR